MSASCYARLVQIVSSAGLLGGLCAASPAWADDISDNGSFCAERPGQTTPPCVLAPHGAMIETGIVTWTRSKADTDQLNEVAIGATTVRYGLAPQIELQVGWAGLISSSHTDAGTQTRLHSTNAGDLTIGTLYNFSGQDGPAALQAYVTLPTGKGTASAGDWGGGVRLPLAVALSGQMSLGVTPEFDLTANSSGNGRHAAFGGAIGVSGSISQSLGVGLDLSVIEDRDPLGAATLAMASGSLAWQTDKDTQLDIGLGFGLAPNSPRIQVYVGFAKRL